MRIASRQLARRSKCPASFCFLSSSCRVDAYLEGRVRSSSQILRSKHSQSQFVPQIHRHGRDLSQSSCRASSTQSNKQEEKAHSYGTVRDYAQELDTFVPLEYRIETFSPNVTTEIRELDRTRILQILRDVSSHHQTDLLAWMIRNGRQKSTVWLIGQLLEGTASSSTLSDSTLPSNIAWPSFTTRASTNISKIWKQSSRHAFTKLTDYSMSGSHMPFAPTADTDREIMDAIWTSLGRLVIDTAIAPDFKVQTYMSAVFLVLAHMHTLGMMPDDIYHYKQLAPASIVQRPPILHLVSSRVLQSLSDAVWRDQQDEAIDIAVKELGISLKELSKNVPGGRFRPRIRPLGPELWIEMLLWSCIESGYTQAGVNIIEMLREDNEHPWFAIRWSENQPHGMSTGRVDWDRVKLRTGGTVGRIEGYSHDEPFVHIPDRTVSVEAVLALVEALINHIDIRRHHNTAADTTRQTMDNIEKVVSFLEPHDLPASYFDYLGSRLMHLEVFEMTAQPILLKEWSQKLKSLRALETIDKRERPQNLELESVLSYGKMLSGIQHQALDGLVQIGDIHDSLELFNEIQEEVDHSKIADIEEFLHDSEMTKAPQGLQDLFALEYAHSHGQMPYYKIAGLLNLSSDADLTGLGQWMIYANDLDGPLIPETAYSISSLTAALYRFAGASDDAALLDRVRQGRVPRASVRASVRTMRSLFNAYLDLNNISQAKATLRDLRESVGGGWSPTNLAHLVAIILRLEDRKGTPPEHYDRTSEARSKAYNLLEDMLEGRFNPKGSDYRSDQNAEYRQQIAHIMKVMTILPRSRLKRIAGKWASKYAGGNNPILLPTAFNRLLSAAIQVHGADFGLFMWNTFCDVSGGIIEERDSVSIQQAYLKSISTNDDVHLEGDDDDPPLQEEQQSIKQLLAPIHITRPNLQTVRLIVRAAVQERENAKDINDYTQRRRAYRRPDYVVEWGVRTLKKFGIPQSTIEQELLLPLSDVIETYTESEGLNMEGKNANGHEALHDVLTGATSVAWAPLGSP